MPSSSSSLSSPKGKKSPLAHFFHILEKKYPSHAPTINCACKAAEKGVDFLDKVYPIGEVAFKKVSKVSSVIKEHKMEQFLPLILGIFVCFFGGCFTMAIAAVEVVHITSWNRIKSSLHTLYINYIAAKEASRKDDDLDEDNNGIKDVLEITRQELFSRKLGVFMRSIDPVGVNEAINALFLAFLAVVAALKDKFAKCLAFGFSLANAIKRFIPLESIFEESLPPEYKKLSGTIANTVLNFIGISIASMAQQYTIAAHCALSGARMFLQSAVELGKARDLVEADVNLDNSYGKALIIALAILGFIWQAANGFALPFPFNFFLFPITILDGLLGFIFRVSVAVVPGQVGK